MKISLGDLPRVRWLQVAQYCLGVFTLWLATSGHLVTVLAAEGITSEMNHPVRTVRINRGAAEDQGVRFAHDSASNFSQLLVDEVNEQLIVAGRDFLFRLNLDNLSRLDVERWASPTDTVSLCITKGQSSDDCRNYITSLYSHNGTLFTCGTNAFAPLCRRYSLVDFSNVIEEESGKVKSPHSPGVNSTSVMTANGDLFVGSRIDFGGNDPTILRSGARPLLRTPQYAQEYLSNPQFIASFEVGPFVYLFFREDAVEYLSCGRAVYSRVARVCKDDPGSDKHSWTTFLKARLNCSLPGSIPFYFNELQSVDYLPERETFFAAFTTGENSIYGSAVCTYTLDDIETAFRGPLTGNFDRWQKGKIASTRFQCQWSDANKGPDGLTHDDVIDLRKYQQTFNAVQASRARPLYHAELERIIQLQADEVQMKASSSKQQNRAGHVGADILSVQVVFAVTLEGTIKKVVFNPLRNSSCVVEYFRPFSDSEKLNQLHLHKRRHALYAATDVSVLKIPLSLCKSYKTRLACLGTGDPYCGWNNREGRCSSAPDGNIDDPKWEQARACAADDRVVDGGWSQWSSWRTCGLLALDGDECFCRQRRCDSPEALNGGADCQGEDLQVANCTRHGGWTDWSAWSACSAPCGPGYQHRTRSCTNPRPVFGGRTCIGQSREERGCPGNPVCHPSGGQGQLSPAVSGITHWSEWGVWSPCSVKCGGGYQIRQRECTLTGARDCELGCTKEYRACNTHECAEVRSAAEWTQWLITNQTGKGHFEQRFRYQCVARVPHSSILRLVATKKERLCSDVSVCHDSRYAAAAAAMSPNGTWSEWSPWAECTVTCGGGIQRRERFCIGGSFDVGGVDCQGQSIEERQCAVHSCPTEGWSEWTDWSECDHRGEQHRKRHCIAKDEYRRRCLGGVHTRESRICLHEGVSLAAVSAVQCGGTSALAVTGAAIVAYMVGLITMILAVRIYNQRHCENAMLNATPLSTSLQHIPVPKRLGSLPLVPVENNTYVPTLTFKGPGQFSTLQHPATAVKAATIKRSNTFRAQISDDHNF